MAKRIKLGRRTELPLFAVGAYISWGPILCIGSVQDLGSTVRGPLMFIAVIVFLVGAVVHILDAIDRHDRAVIEKIDDSVGDVYEAGAKAKQRQMDLAAAEPQLAVVHDLSPR